MKTLADNRRANFDYDIKDTFAAGLMLSGAEVKSVKSGNVSLAGSYVAVADNGARLLNAHIGAYKYARNEAYDPTQSRRLLMNKREINQLLGKEKGLVIVPLEIFQTKQGWLKIKLGLGRARKKRDKREAIKKRETQREIKQSF
ncbi:MAG: SsrA-binding protein SmpB [Candidatus Doudnabacteria bacterium]|nr:SsrA-binding protein SmpB [Candidatus Doudnabacteria bacterium]